MVVGGTVVVVGGAVVVGATVVVVGGGGVGTPEVGSPRFASSALWAVLVP